jgi:hypothetical protein
LMSFKKTLELFDKEIWKAQMIMTSCGKN